MPLACLSSTFACVDPGDADSSHSIEGEVAPRSGDAAIDPGACGNTDEVVWDLTRAPFGMVHADADAAVIDALAEVDGFFDACPGRDLVLYFPDGVWTFDDVLFDDDDHPLDDDRRASIHLAHLRPDSGSLTLRGAGSDSTHLSFSHFRQMGMLFEDTVRVTVEKMHLTRPGLYVSQGTVTKVEPGFVYFKKHQAFPDPALLAAEKNALDNDRTLIRFRGDPLDPELAPNSVSLKLCKFHPTNCPYAVELVNADTREYRAILDEPTVTADLKKNDWVALKAKVGANTVRALDSDDFSVVDVKFTRHSAVSLVVDGDSNRTLVDHVRVERTGPVSGRVPFFSGPGGGPQISARTDGPTIQHCTITATTDDAIAVFSTDSSSRGALMSGARIEHNTIRDTQGRSINITQSKSGYCRYNHLTRGQNPSIQLKNNQNAGGNASVFDWLIEGNTIVQPWTDPAINLAVEGPSSESGLHTKNRIVGNTFVEASRDNPLIEIDQTDRLHIADNVVESFSTEDDVAEDDVPSPPPLVLVKDALDVDGVGNVCEQATTRPIVYLANGVDPTAVTMKWTCD